MILLKVKAKNLFKHLDLINSTLQVVENYLFFHMGFWGFGRICNESSN